MDIPATPLPTATAGEIAWAAAWFAVLAWWILRGRFFRRSPLRRGVLLAAFAAKVAGGVAYGLVYYHFYRTGDVVHYFQDARKLWTLLPERPDDYLHLVFGYARDGVAPEHLRDVYEHLRGSWRTPEFLSVRVHGVLGLLTGMHFYANMVLLNGASLAGLVLLHAAFARTWPRAAGWLAVPVFFLPSALFWCSGIHKDAFALLAIGLAVYALTMPRARLRARHGLLLAGAAFLLLNSRPYLLLLLLPNAAVLAWGLRRDGPHALRFALVNAALVLLLAQAGRISPRLDLLDRMAFETAFLQELKGNVHLDMPPPARDLGGLVRNLPVAVDHVFWQPVVHPPRHAFQVATALTSAAQLLALALLAFRIPWRRRHPPLAAFSAFLTLGVFLLVGLTVPALGAIVRYKSALLPLAGAAAVALARPWPGAFGRRLSAGLPPCAPPDARPPAWHPAAWTRPDWGF